MEPWIIINIIILAIVVLIIALVSISRIQDKRLTLFVSLHSDAINKIIRINGRYDFFLIPGFDIKQVYDNENYYDTISPLDCLIYRLAHRYKDVAVALSAAKDNERLLQKYLQEIKESCKLGVFNNIDKTITKRMLKKEEKLFNSMIKRPEIVVVIQVVVTLTNINGMYRGSKSESFYESTIKTIIDKVKNRNGSYYNDRGVWESICRVERGKVTNRMRFAVYNRDGNRCVRCGSRYNLEIDHIVPIAKGGKTEYSNLQTLCHRCNVKKGDSLDWC